MEAMVDTKRLALAKVVLEDDPFSFLKGGKNDSQKF